MLQRAVSSATLRLLAVLAVFVSAMPLARAVAEPAANCSAPVETSFAEPDDSAFAQRRAETGNELWLAGNVEGARSAWLTALGAKSADGPALPRQARASLLYNLGVAAQSGGESLRAAAWFEAALRLAPRHSDALHNREIARVDAGLEPARSGTFTGALVELAAAFTPVEAQWFALLGALLMAIAATIGVIRRVRWLPWAMLVAQVAFFAPLTWQALHAEDDAMMVTEKAGAPVTIFADAASEQVGRLDAGDIVPRVERLGVWTKVVFKGEERWVPTDDVTSLAR